VAPQSLLIESISIRAEIGREADLTVTEEIEFWAAEREKTPGTGIEVYSDMTVTQRLLYWVIGEEVKYGFIRSIPTLYSMNGYTKKAKFDLIKVTLDGQKTQAEVKTTRTGAEIRIGDTGEMFPHGSHTIVLTYRITGIIGFFDNHDELYWNAIGLELAYPVLKCDFSLRLPGRGWGEEFNSVEWHVGKSGSKDDSSRVGKLDDNSIELKTSVNRGEVFTVVYTWNKGIVKEPFYVFTSFSNSFDGMQYLIIPILMAVFYYIVWAYLVKDGRIGTIIPVFYPPRNIGITGEVDPGSARYSIERGFDNSCFTASLINLAVKGYLHIVEGTSISRTDKAISDVLPNAEVSLLKSFSLYGGSMSITESSYTKSSNYALISARKDSELFMEKYGEVIFTFNRVYWFAGIAFLLLFPILDYASHQSEDYGTKILLSIAIIACFFEWHRSIKNLNTKLRYMFFTILVVLIYVAIQMYFEYVLMQTPINWTLLALNVTISGLCYYLISLFRKLLAKYSREGKKLVAAVEGLKLYINYSEKSRIEFFNPPKETPEVFEKILPWAIALGLTRKWIDRFDSVLAKAKYKPTWYSGDIYSLLYDNGIDKLTSNIAKASVKKEAERK
jgi:hypothetical protein